ncbi:unnamed protein product [Caenorhabditis auriculariae]|uniref:WAPL domain-containing protein n=1 Tax=Caenorhabditis auriculariae TaxID=2777116 RepID=A0A8S1H7V8_9PELO|nr:unnamed protein product [Caenorhabditis auriculariae]
MKKFRTYEPSSTSNDDDDAFSKPVVRQRFQKSQVNLSEVPPDDNILPSVSDDSSPIQVFSPQVSIPESSSTDGNPEIVLSSSSSEDESPPLPSSQSSTDSINKKLRSSSLATEDSTTRFEKKGRSYEFDEDDELLLAPSSKKSKVQEANEKFIPRKDKKVVYNHKWNVGEEDEESGISTSSKSSEVQEVKSTKTVNTMAIKRPIYATAAGGGGRIRNVKEAHEILESGEHDDFKHELEYILSTLRSDGKLKLKCLSTVSLAKKCVSSEFRHFIRSEGMTNTVIRALSESPENDIFALCAASVIYLLSRDFNNVKVDANGLRLFSQLLRVEKFSSEEKQEFLDQVWEVFRCFKKIEVGGKRIVFDMQKEDLTPSSLALEALVFVVSRNAHDEALKTELLNLGVLQWIVAKIEKMVAEIEKSQEVAQPDEVICHELMLLDRCFRAIEMCSMLHRKNQAFLISHRGSILVKTCATFLDVIHSSVIKRNANDVVTKSYMNCLALLTNVLINLSHENELCCSKLGQIEGFLVSCSNALTFLAPKYASEDKKYDIQVTMTSLLVNLVERCNANRKSIINAQIKVYISEEEEVEETDALQALAKLFMDRESKAKTVDEDLDKELAFEENPEDGSGSDEEDEEGARKDGRLDRAKLESMGEEDMVNAVQQVMSKASTHMEDSVVASYVGLLIGCLLQQNEEKVELVKKCMRDGTLSPMTEQLHRFLDFMRFAMKTKKNGQSSCRSIEKILDFLERLD